MKMPFGKYKGCELSGLPDDYLLWLYKGHVVDLRDPLKTAVLDEIHRRARSADDYGLDQAPDEVSATIRILPERIRLARLVFEAGYRAVALKAHPDIAGGHSEVMTQLNLLAESIRAQFEAMDSK